MMRTGTPDLAFKSAPEASPSPSQVRVTISPGNLSAGVYDIVVDGANDPTGCSGTLVGGLEVVDLLTLNITTAEPTFVSQLAATPIAITGEGFAQVPRVFVSLPGANAQSLRAVI